MNVLRGQIFFAYLDPVFGREIGGFKVRPVVVISAYDIHNSPWGLATVVPGTTTIKTARNLVLVEPSQTNGLTEKTVFQCHQLRALDKARFTSRAVGRLDQKDMDRLVDAIKFSLAME